MKLPGAHQAVIAPEKLEGYALSTTHHDGKHKARVLRAALGLGAEHVAVLREALLRAVIENDAVEGLTDEHGTRYAVDFVLSFEGRSALLRSGWVVAGPGQPPKLATVFVLETNDNG